MNVCTGLGFVATIEGGEGGFSLIKKRAGSTMAIVMRPWISIKV